MRVLPHFKQVQALSKDEQKFIVLKEALPFILVKLLVLITNT